ncbi:lmo0954 family membrane protein [Geobacillus sp. YF-1]|uniref:lmo0954 family membrane protein n=1 Tax=Geobacillus sp. YF-1 TaxID=3457480 RepID=UPI0040455FDB
MAKKIGLFVAGAAALLVFLFHLGPLVGLVITLAILYYAFKKCLKAPSTFGKVVWALIGCAALVASASNVPALMALVAAYVLYVVYKQWNGVKGERVVSESDDPFVNFEKQWAELQKQY